MIVAFIVRGAVPVMDAQLEDTDYDELDLRPSELAIKIKEKRGAYAVPKDQGQVWTYLRHGALMARGSWWRQRCSRSVPRLRTLPSGSAQHRKPLHSRLANTGPAPPLRRSVWRLIGIL